jgi:hypothetical protein
VSVILPSWIPRALRCFLAASNVKLSGCAINLTDHFPSLLLDLHLVNLIHSTLTLLLHSYIISLVSLLFAPIVLHCITSCIFHPHISRCTTKNIWGNCVHASYKENEINENLHSWQVMNECFRFSYFQELRTLSATHICFIENCTRGRVNESAEHIRLFCRICSAHFAWLIMWSMHVQILSCKYHLRAVLLSMNSSAYSFDSIHWL